MWIGIGLPITRLVLHLVLHWLKKIELEIERNVGKMENSIKN